MASVDEGALEVFSRRGCCLTRLSLHRSSPWDGSSWW